jgi:hypothetical protein
MAIANVEAVLVFFGRKWLWTGVQRDALFLFLPLGCVKDHMKIEQGSDIGMNNHLFREKIIQPPLHHFPVIRFYGEVTFH